MTNSSSLRFRRLSAAAVTITVLLGAPAAALAQIGQAGQGQGASPPVQVPLSGRTAPGGGVVATQSGPTAATSGVNTVRPVVQVQGAFGGSTRAGEPPLSGPLTLREAVRRGVEYNLGALNIGQALAQARGQRTVSRSALLPNISGDASATVQKINLSAMGLRFDSPIEGFDIPAVVGPFTLYDFRARLTQKVVDFTALNNYRASAETVRANELSAEDAHNLVVLAVGGAYLDVVAARAMVEAGRAQLATANTLFELTEQRRQVGLAAQVDVGRSQVQALTQRQRLTSLQNGLAKLKITLARMVGLPATDQYEIGDGIPFLAAPEIPLETALQQAKERRADLKAAEAQLRAAERSAAAARATRLPSASVSADYGAIGGTVPDARNTYAVVGRISVPIWNGGAAGGQIQQAEAAVRQRRAELEDLAGQIEADVRKAYLDLDAAASQVEVAQLNQTVAGQTLDLTRQRFDAGISDNVEVVQAQEAVAIASLDYINSVFAHNVAKLSLARALGVASEQLATFLKLE